MMVASLQAQCTKCQFVVSRCLPKRKAMLLHVVPFKFRLVAKGCLRFVAVAAIGGRAIYRRLVVIWIITE